MIKKISIRMRLTILSMILLTMSCAVLTIILNFSANEMANVIEAVPITPSYNINGTIIDSYPMSTVKPSETTQAARKVFKFKSILYMLLIISSGGILTYYLSGKALAPLNELNSQIKNITVYNLSEDIKAPEARDEIYDITNSFNEMTQKLNNAFLMQKRFSQNAAHELRTPLTVLKTKLDVFKKKQTHSTEEYNSLIEIISLNTDRLSSLVKSLLDFTNMENIELNQRIALHMLLQDVSYDLAPLAKCKNINITIAGQEKNILGNQDLLYRAFYNLIENSIKYNVDAGIIDIDIDIKSLDNKTIITIKDTGIGIPDDMKKDIFEPFFRVDKSRSRQIAGAGLGLSIVKAIIESHNGTITVKNNSPAGTIFTITI